MSGLVKMLGGGCWSERVLICLLLIIEVGTQRSGPLGSERREMPPGMLLCGTSDSNTLF